MAKANFGNAEVQVRQILKKYKAVLVRTKHHFVWKFPHGPVFTQACTPRDADVAARNQLAVLKRLLGLNERQDAPTERRERNRKPGRSAPTAITPSASTAMLEAMRRNGLVEEALHAKIATLGIELRAQRQANGRKKRELSEMQGHCRRCWGCALWRWWRRFSRRPKFSRLTNRV